MKFAALDAAPKVGAASPGRSEQHGEVAPNHDVGQCIVTQGTARAEIGLPQYPKLNTIDREGLPCTALTP